MLNMKSAKGVRECCFVNAVTVNYYIVIYCIFRITNK